MPAATDAKHAVARTTAGEGVGRAGNEGATGAHGTTAPGTTSQNPTPTLDGITELQEANREAA